jgi:hypothetical protein
LLVGAKTSDEPEKSRTSVMAFMTDLPEFKLKIG